MPRAPITYQSRPQKWTEETLNDALNSFQYGILKALDLLSPSPSSSPSPDNEVETLNLPGFIYEPKPNDPPQITNNTVSHGEPYPAPLHKKWLRNRGRLAVAASSFITQGLWPTPLIQASAHRTGSDLSMSPKVALAMIGMTAPATHTAILTSGLSPHLDRITASQGMEYESHSVRTPSDRKFPSDHVRELVRMGRRPGAELMPFAQRILIRPLRSLLREDPRDAHKPKTSVTAKWLYETSLLTGVPVIAFVRYAEFEYFEYGVTYMNKDALIDLIGLIYEVAPIPIALELEETQWELPAGDYW